MYKSPSESIHTFVSAGYPALAQTMYFSRHNEIAKIIHHQLTLKYKLVDIPPTTPFCKYSPTFVLLESGNIVMYYD